MGVLLITNSWLRAVLPIACCIAETSESWNQPASTAAPPTRYLNAIAVVCSSSKMGYVREIDVSIRKSDRLRCERTSSRAVLKFAWPRADADAVPRRASALV